MSNVAQVGSSHPLVIDQFDARAGEGDLADLEDT